MAYPCVQGFYSTLAVFLLWIIPNEIVKMRNSHTIMHILGNTSYIYLEIQTIKTFIRSHGTCLRASAFRELKILIQHNFVLEQHKILIHLKHDSNKQIQENNFVNNTLLHLSKDLVHGNVHPWSLFIDSIVLGVQHSKGILASVHPGLLSNMTIVFCS